MIPPVSSAFDLYFAPNTFPTLTPAMDKQKVVMPIMEAAMVIFTFRNAKVIPTARASMLVATAKSSIVRKERESFACSSFPTMLPLSYWRL